MFSSRQTVTKLGQTGDVVRIALSKVRQSGKRLGGTGAPQRPRYHSNPLSSG